MAALGSATRRSGLSPGLGGPPGIAPAVDDVHAGRDVEIGERRLELDAQRIWTELLERRAHAAQERVLGRTIAELQVVERVLDLAQHFVEMVGGAVIRHEALVSG